jgi:hypothetical protein
LPNNYGRKRPNKKGKIFIGKTGYLNLVVLYWRKALIAAAKKLGLPAGRLLSKKQGHYRPCFLHCIKKDDA